MVEHLSKRFGDRVAFDDVSFEVGYGEVFGFLGPNGAGKTTTVRTLGTLIAPTSGSAVVAGIPLSADNGSAIRSRISIMPESPGLYLRLTVMEDLQCFSSWTSRVASLRDRGVTIFLTTHRLEEAERLCHRVAILSTTLRLIGRPDELRQQLFRRSLDVRLRAPLDDPRLCCAVCLRSKDGRPRHSATR